MKLALIAFFLMIQGQRLFGEDRPTSFPFISGDTFRAYSQWIVDDTEKSATPDQIAAVGDGDLIFVKGCRLKAFFEKFHPKITNLYLLVTHNSDDPVPGKFASYLDDNRIIAWYGQNATTTMHVKMHQVPIGLANGHWDHGKLEIFQDALASPPPEREILLYMNFRIKNYPKEREPLFRLFVFQPYCTTKTPGDLAGYLADLRCSKFVLSPRGFGLDCHRTWEALLMGAIPIVISSPLDPLFEELPVLIIERWEQITEEFLESQYLEMSDRRYNLRKLYFNYWLEQIQANVVFHPDWAK